MPTAGPEGPDCAVIIPTYNGAGLTARCLEALLEQPPAACRWRLVVVDDASTDRTVDELSRFSEEIELVVQEANTGFAGACNAGAAAAPGSDYLVFLNNDTVPLRGWLDALVAEPEADPGVAAAGARLLYPGGRIQHAGVVIGQDRWPHHIYAGLPGDHPAVMRKRDVTAVTAACMLVRRSDFDALGGFDTGYHNGYEDIDLCLRLGERGRRIRYCPASVLYHLESVTRWPSGTPGSTEISDRRFADRWGAKVTPEDVERYLEDGLLAVGYGPHYPVRMAISPQLAVVERDAEEPAALERLLGVRSRQVMELLSAETRRELRERAASSPPPPLDPAARNGSRMIREGREHSLGGYSGPRLISIVMPVKDAAEDLRELLPIVLGQSLPTRLEIVAVDSGSSDDTVEVLSQFGATVAAIEPAAFDHGLTRNLAARHARGDVLVFLNKRSRPVDERWLAPLIAALDGDPQAVGACSRVVPHPQEDILTRRDAEHELSGSTRRERKHITDWGAYQMMSSEARRAFLNFHTVSAAIRADALERTPFRSVRTIGEDLLWAREVLESGWALIHEPASVVRHSHPYSVVELLARNVDDGVANRDINDRELSAEEILPAIRAMVQEDWAYLRQALGPDGQELEHWQVEAVLRRTAQLVGQWIGVNYDTLPEGMASRFSRVAETRALR